MNLAPVWINGFPLPPSVNSSLIPVVGKVGRDKNQKPIYRARMIESKEHRTFLKECKQWGFRNRNGLAAITQEIRAYKEHCEKSGVVFALKVDCYFVFHVERLITVNKKSEQIDADNRLKACWDGVSDILGIDDKAFYAGHCEKVTTLSKELECSMIKISPMHPRTYEQIKSIMLKEMTTPGS